MEKHLMINQISQQHNLQNYLEIGVRDTSNCFDKIVCQNKWSVDPGVEWHVNLATFPYESDVFFKKLERGYLNLPQDFKWDIVLIDGLHLADQVYRDFMNSMNHLSDEGFILFHDTNPPTIHHAREDYEDESTPASYWWMGTCWKAIQKIRQTHRCSVFTMNDDWGVTAVRKKDALSMLNPDFNPFFEYNEFSRHRETVLNLGGDEDFLNWMK